MLETPSVMTEVKLLVRSKLPSVWGVEPMTVYISNGAVKVMAKMWYAAENLAYIVLIDTNLNKAVCLTWQLSR